MTIFNKRFRTAKSPVPQPSYWREYVGHAKAPATRARYTLSQFAPAIRPSNSG
ncbi:hypothetical protein [Mucilaginibacter sp. CSA2-8R]|uniref:hypothetical protein n=1 Tax=Mucilaginibacter sp. CSA2-8R TaxID=3141542 RepID=UPI00315DB0BF